jgi:hypothetical protein
MVRHVSATTEEVAMTPASRERLLEEALKEALDGWEFAGRYELEGNENIDSLRSLLVYDEREPDWFPNEGDRQWWREKHLLSRAADGRTR